MNPTRKSTARGLILSLVLAGIWTVGAWAQAEITPEPIAPLPEAGAVVAPVPPVDPGPDPVEVQPAAPVSDLPPLTEPAPPVEPSPDSPVEPGPAPAEAPLAAPAPDLPPLAEPGIPTEPATPATAPAPDFPPMAEQGQPAVSAPSEASAPAQLPVPGLGGIVLGPVTHPTPAQHKIVEGDDLHLLAAYYYGNARLWRLIYEANRNVIPNPSKLTEGITITIPAPPI